MILVVIGISGSGKTTLARGLASRLDWRFVEGDDFHSAANRAKMSAGIALTDQDRLPWLKSLHREMSGLCERRENAVLTCSALRRVYRQILLTGEAAEGGKEEEVDAVFILLNPSSRCVEERLRGRVGHFMPASLLEDQLRTLELPTSAADARFLTVDNENCPLDEVIRSLVESVGKMRNYRQLHSDPPL